MSVCLERDEEATEGDEGGREDWLAALEDWPGIVGSAGTERPSPVTLLASESDCGRLLSCDIFTKSQVEVSRQMAEVLVGTRVLRSFCGSLSLVKRIRGSQSLFQAVRTSNTDCGLSVMGARIEDEDGGSDGGCPPIH